MIRRITEWLMQELDSIDYKDDLKVKVVATSKGILVNFDGVCNIPLAFLNRFDEFLNSELDCFCYCIYNQSQMSLNEDLDKIIELRTTLVVHKLEQNG